MRARRQLSRDPPFRRRSRRGARRVELRATASMEDHRPVCWPGRTNHAAVRRDRRRWPAPSRAHDRRRGVHLQAHDRRAAAGRLPRRDAGRSARWRRSSCREASGWASSRPRSTATGRSATGCSSCGSDVDVTVDPVQLVIDGDQRLRRIAVFDAAVNNTDRKAGHLLPVPGGHIYGVDHGVCFSPVPKLRTVLWGWRGEPFDGGGDGGAARGCAPGSRRAGRRAAGLLARRGRGDAARRPAAQDAAVPAARSAAAGAPLAAGLRRRERWFLSFVTPVNVGHAIRDMRSPERPIRQECSHGPRSRSRATLSDRRRALI